MLPFQNAKQWYGIWSPHRDGYEEFYLQEHNTLLSNCVHTGLLLRLFFDPENGGDKFLQNISWCSLDQKVLYAKWWNYSENTYVFCEQIIFIFTMELDATHDGMMPHQWHLQHD